MSLEIKGTLQQIGDTIAVNEKFKKREFVLAIIEDINGNSYTNFGRFQLVQNKCDILDNYRQGESVIVKFNIKGNSYVDKKSGETKYITNLDAWKIERTAGQQAPQQAAPQQSYQGPAFNNTIAHPSFTQSAETYDDLPF